MNDFKSLGLSQPLLDAVEALGFESPTPIQVEAIPALLKGDTDLVGLAQTGTGKTAAFGLPLLQLIDPKEKSTQALVLAPTRELCIQITNEMELFAKNLPKIKICPVYGGTDINRQIKSVKAGAQVIVATPGRLKDLQNRKVVNLKLLKILVLDEADEMLNMGFKPEIDHILRGTSDEKLTWLFSATMPEEVRRISDEYMHKPLELSMGEKNASNEDIDHQYVIVSRHDRYDALTCFLDSDESIFGLVFCRTRHETKKLAKKLNKDGYSADALHGDLTQSKRDKVMGKFRQQQLQVLIATDVAARGIDVQNITHVFHYNIPDDISFYTHRSGRTARAGQKGISLVLAEPADRRLIRQLERITQARFTEVRLPSGASKEERNDAKLEKQMMTWLEDFINVPIHKTAKKQVKKIDDFLGEMSKKDILLRLGSLAFVNTESPEEEEEEERSSRYSERNGRNERGRRNERSERSERSERGERGERGEKSKKPRPVNDDASDGAFKRLFINIGSMDVAGKGEFINLIAEHADISGRAIGKIAMNRKHTFFEVEERILAQVIDRFDQSTFDGRDIRINEEEGPIGESPKGDFDRKKQKKKARRF